MTIGLMSDVAGDKGAINLNGANTILINSTSVSVLTSLSIANTTNAPSSASDTGTTGQVRIDSDYIYVCVATDTWKRVAISTWP